jgi:hypothetical protein
VDNDQFEANEAEPGLRTVKVVSKKVFMFERYNTKSPETSKHENYQSQKTPKIMIKYDNVIKQALVTDHED